MAASLVAGVAVTWGVLRSTGEPPIVASDAGLVARGELADALSTGLSGDVGAGPAAVVVDWVNQQSASSLYLSAITQAEVVYGIALLPEGRRKQGIADAADQAFNHYFAERILPFDGAAAAAYAAIAAERRALGRPIAQFDAQIAAIARSRGATLPTRNAGDFEDCGIIVVNPWTPVS